jgi:hypothetical protein
MGIASCTAPDSGSIRCTASPFAPHREPSPTACTIGTSSVPATSPDAGSTRKTVLATSSGRVADRHRAARQYPADARLGARVLRRRARLSATFAELLIEREEDRALRAVLVGMLRSRTASGVGLGLVGDCPTVLRHVEQRRVPLERSAVVAAHDAGSTTCRPVRPEARRPRSSSGRDLSAHAHGLLIHVRAG